jgi:uncharacterized membrane protein
LSDWQADRLIDCSFLAGRLAGVHLHLLLRSVWLFLTVFFSVLYSFLAYLLFSVRLSVLLVYVAFFCLLHSVWLSNIAIFCACHGYFLFLYVCLAGVHGYFNSILSFGWRTRLLSIPFCLSGLLVLCWLPRLSDVTG